MPRLLLLGVIFFHTPAFLGAQDLLYVASQEEVTVSIIDTKSNKLVETVDLKTLGFPESAKAHHTAVEPDGSFWYVSLISAGKILKFD
jgi:YVTN family beta-propeller protein